MKHAAMMLAVCMGLSMMGCARYRQKRWQPLYPSAMSLPKTAEERLLSLNPLWVKVAVIDDLLYEYLASEERIVVFCSIRPIYGGLSHHDFIIRKTHDDKDWSNAECYFFNGQYYHSLKEVYGLSWDELAKDVIPISKAYFKYDTNK